MCECVCVCVRARARSSSNHNSTSAMALPMPLAWCAGTSLPLESSGTIQQLFAAAANTHSDRIAVTDANHQSLTYGELHRASGVLSTKLRAVGVQPDELVALMTERGQEMVVGMLGILSAGGAYVSCSPTVPQLRLQSMLDDAAAKVPERRTSHAVIPCSAMATLHRWSPSYPAHAMVCRAVVPAQVARTCISSFLAFFCFRFLLSASYLPKPARVSAFCAAPFLDPTLLPLSAVFVPFVHALACDSRAECSISYLGRLLWSGRDLRAAHTECCLVV